MIVDLYMIELTDGTDDSVGKIKTVVKVPFVWIIFAFCIIEHRFAAII